jgi:sulfotransferase famil protein
MQRDQLPIHTTATFVMPRWKAVYVSVNKAACTSLKWLVADLQGESRERFHRSLSREVSRTMTIHRRSLWQHTPMAKRLPDDELAAISPDNGWFIFAVVRHPSARIFSAWQSKLLLREPWWEPQFGDQPWFPRLPESSEELVEDFRGFVTAMAAEPDQRIMRNRHFAPQGEMLALGRMPYTKVYETREIPQLLADFETHLRAQGWDGPKLALERANETPLKPIAALFPAETVEQIAALYTADFATLPYDDPRPGGIDAAERYTDAQIAEIHRLVERAERISDLALRARAFKRRAERAAAAGAPAPQPAPSPVRRFAWRAKRRLVG